MNKLISFTLSFIIIFCCSIPQKINADYCDDVEQTINEILDFNLKQCGADSVQGWIDGELSENIGDGSEWYVFGLSKSGKKYDFSMYQNALDEYLNNHSVPSATSKIKFGLIYLAISGSDEYATQIIDETIGKQGVTSYIFGLHLLANGVESEIFNLEDVKSKLISMQHSDGGWSVTGEKSDVDVTAMAVQALAPYYDLDSSVRSSIDSAVDFLSSSQNENGSYLSFDVENLESTTEVLMAMSQLKIDFTSDERFIKNGKNLLDVALDYKLDDGSFQHEINKGYNSLATAKMFCGLIAYSNFLKNNSNFYDFNSQVNNYCDNVSDVQTEQAKNDYQKVLQAEVDSGKSNSNNMTSNFVNKPLFCVVILLIGATVIVILKCKKRLNIKNLLVCFILIILGISFVLLNDFQGVKEYYGAEQSDEEIVGSVEISIRCDSLAGKEKNAYIPEDCIILNNENIEINKDDTVYDVLVSACRKKKIQFENNGATEKLAYISGINYLYEFDYGELSGWIYTVNGKKTSVGCGEYDVVDGDVIEWRYSCNLGKDIEVADERN